MTLSVGSEAPDFSLTDQNGDRHALKDYRGKWVLAYFYPKDDTPGCTAEACGLRDRFAEAKKAGLVVLGVSKDSEKSHAKFAAKFRLPFTLLADTEMTMMKAYGTWGPKKFMGREYMGTMRSSFLIDPQGRIAKIYEKVKPDTHAEDVLKDLRELR